MTSSILVWRLCVKNMGKHKRLAEDFLEHLLEDIGLETLLELNDVEPVAVLELLIEHGWIDLDDLRWELNDDDE